MRSMDVGSKARRALIKLLTPISRLSDNAVIVQRLRGMGITHLGDFLFCHCSELLDLNCPEFWKLVHQLEAHGLRVGQFRNNEFVMTLFLDAVATHSLREQKPLPVGSGNPHPVCPRSEREYHGDRFHGAEW